MLALCVVIIRPVAKNHFELLIGRPSNFQDVVELLVAHHAKRVEPEQIASDGVASGDILSPCKPLADMREKAASVNSNVPYRFRICVARGRIKKDGNRITKAGFNAEKSCKFR